MADPATTRALLAAKRQRTLDRLAGLEREFSGIVGAARSASTDDEHDPEGATIAFERQHVAALLGEDRQRLTEIEAALRKLDEGRYGTCERCGQLIGAQRLAARPAAARCIGRAAQP
jgi:RNA polymerase-binding transcription factor DksA